jgi:endonuclease/exonuclease/phosphatase family metal-dependent hydrolase
VFRGFVGVDAVVDGATYRFVTTHLEVQAVGTAIQQAQAAELVGTLGLATPPERSLILVGDFNSAPTEPAGSVYAIIRAAAYAAAWQRNSVTSSTPDGFTCCQASDLTNDVSLLDRRIDHIFVKNNLGVLPFSFPGLVFATVLGDAPISASQPKWSSDHAGPFAALLGIPLFEQLGSLQHASTP